MVPREMSLEQAKGQEILETKNFGRGLYPKFRKFLIIAVFPKHLVAL